MKKLALVINHFPGQGRLSGLVSFAKALVPVLAMQLELTVFTGQATNMVAIDGVPVHVVSVRPFFWFRVWRRVEQSYDGIIVLSGVHSPGWLRVVLAFMGSSGSRSSKTVFVQAVTLDRELQPALARKLGSVARNVAFLNPFEARRARNHLSKAVYLRSGIDQRKLGCRPRRVEGAPVRVGFLGHLNRVKGADRLPAILEGMRAVQWEAVIAGTGEFAAGLQSWAARWPHVKMEGYLADPFMLLRTCDLLLAPFQQSNTVLGISQVVLEAQALGIPVVGTRVEAISAIVNDGENGILDDTDEGLSIGLSRLIVDESLRSEMSHRAAERASRYSIDRTARELIDMLSATSPEMAQ